MANSPQLETDLVWTAFEFAMWISPEFKVYVVREFQRLKADEQKQLAWSAKRELSKINYRIHTDAIKSNLIPAEAKTKNLEMIMWSTITLLVSLWKTLREIQFLNQGQNDNHRGLLIIESENCL